MKHGAAGPGLVPADLERHSIEIDRKNLRAALGSRSTEGKDSVRIIVRALDQAGNKLPFLLDPVEIDVEGAATLSGPDLVPLRGGATGFWLESTGTPGPITVKVTGQRFGTTTISLSAT